MESSAAWQGRSTPIVWGKRIFLTAPSNGLNAVLAFDWGGRPLWRSTLGPERAAKLPNFSGNPSPVTDGKAVFVYCNSGTLAALGLEGKVRWQTNLVAGLGPDNLYWDQGTSPVLTKDYVVIARMNRGESWLAAFDNATGQMRWKVPRNYEPPEEDDHVYTTPLLIEHHGKPALLVWGGGETTTESWSGLCQLLGFCGSHLQI